MNFVSSLSSVVISFSSYLPLSVFHRYLFHLFFFACFSPDVFTVTSQPCWSNNSDSCHICWSCVLSLCFLSSQPHVFSCCHQDVDTIYLTQDTKELNLQDFVHLDNKYWNHSTPHYVSRVTLNMGGPVWSSFFMCSIDAFNYRFSCFVVDASKGPLGVTFFIVLGEWGVNFQVNVSSSVWCPFFCVTVWNKWR